MSNKRGRKDNPSIVCKKWNVAKIRSMYRRFGWDKIPIGREFYKLTLCSHLYYLDRPCDAICDTVEKRIYIVISDIDYKQLQTKLFTQFIYASLHENNFTTLPHWSRHLEDSLVDALSADFDRFFDVRVRKQYRPS